MVKSVFNFTFTLISFLVLALLLAPTTINGIIIYLCGGLLTSIIFGMIKSRVQFEASHSTKIYAFEMMFTLFLIHDFYHLWIPSSRLSVLSKSLHMSTELFLWIVAGTLGILSLRAIDRVIQLVQVMLQRIPVKESVEGAIKNCFYIFIVLLLESYQMDYSVLSSLKSFFGHGILIICVNILLAFLLNMIFVVLMQRWKYALFITNCFFTVWSIANYYVIKFHGSPLFPITLYTSGRTGLEVAGTYRYTPDYTVVCLVSICLVNSMIVFSCLKEVKTAFSLRNISLRLISVGSIFAVLVILFMGKGGILPAGGSKETWDHRLLIVGS